MSTISLYLHLFDFAQRYEYLRTDPLNLEIESRELMEKQRGFQLINPTEKWFPGLDASREMFASWDWRIGKTPKFSVLKDVRLKSTGQEVDQQTGAAEDANLLKLKVDVVSVSNNIRIVYCADNDSDCFPTYTRVSSRTCRSPIRTLRMNFPL